MSEVDPSIVLAGKPVQIDNPLDVQAKAYSLKQLGLQTQQAQQDYQDSQTLRSIYQNNVDPKTGQLDMNGFSRDGYSAGVGAKVAPVIAGVLANRKTGSEIDKNEGDANSANANADSKNFDLHMDRLSHMAGALNNLQQGTVDPTTGQRLPPTAQDVTNAVHNAVDGGIIDAATGAQIVRNIPPNASQIPGFLQSAIANTQTAQQQAELKKQQIEAAKAGAPVREDLGGTIQGFDPVTGKAVGAPIQKTLTPGEASSASQAAARLAFDQAKQQTGGLTPDALEQAYQQFKVTGDMPNAGKGGAAQQAAYANFFAKRAGEDGDTGAQQASRRLQFHASAGVLHDFESGQTSKDITALNTSIKHVQVLEPLIDSLGNTDSKLVNTAKNAFSTQFGGTAPNDFNGVRDFVTGEISKAVLPAGGDAAERDSLKQAAASANSPAQLKSILDKWEELLAGKTDAIRNKWDVGTGGNQGSFDKFLLPETKVALGRHGLAPAASNAPGAPTGTRPPLDSIFGGN